MLITLDMDKKKFKYFLEANLFNENIFDLQTRLNIIKDMEFAAEDSGLLSLLSEDESQQIREIAALNENTPEEVLEELSFDESDIVRKALAMNIKISEEILEDLCYDDSKDVREAALSRAQDFKSEDEDEF